jgi:DNA-binding beta-propeller fold protein YncE
MKTLIAAIIASLSCAAIASDLDEFKVKRQAVYEFTQAPKVTRNGDRIAIAFTSKGYCDATVAIEDADGKIIRHLASGVLGKNAPPPFQKESLKQTLVWDGKNDQGTYIDDKDAITVRVSLGLKARYEKNLMWEPKKRVSRGGAASLCTEDVIPVATPDGVYVYDGNGVDHVRLFDHEGNYVRTVYPFPAGKLKEIRNLEWRKYPQGYSRPKKHGLNQTTFLTSGHVNTKRFQQAAAYAMAVYPSKVKGRSGRIALVKTSLNRLATDGGVPASESGKALPLDGPKTYVTVDGKKWSGNLHRDTRICPFSIAFAPDGRRLYMTGFNGDAPGWVGRWNKYWLDGVKYLDYETNEKPKVFLGAFKKFAGIHAGVACDRQGRVYISDYIGNSVDVYTPDAKLLKKIAVSRPTQICVNPTNGEIYVFSWYLGGPVWAVHPELKKLKGTPMPKAALTVLKSFDDPRKVAGYPLPYVATGSWGLALTGWGNVTHGTEVRATVDFWADKPTIWLVPKAPMGIRHKGSEGTFNFGQGWTNSGLILLQADGGKLKVVRNFSEDTVKSVKKLNDNLGHQRLYVNPANENLYVTDKEHNVGGGEFSTLWEVVPASGAVRKRTLPVSSAEDMAFDLDGRAYLRQIKGYQRVVRYDPKTWREIPWDYGERGRDKKTEIIAALKLPAAQTGWQSEGGIWVSPKGHVAVWCSVRTKDKRTLLVAPGRRFSQTDIAYKPPIYPGRKMAGSVHVWDKHGKVVYEDAVPGVSMLDGLAIDRNDDLYLLSWIPRVLDGKKYPNSITGTLIKVSPGKNKWYSDSRFCAVPLRKERRPGRHPDISGYTMGTVWVEGAKWFYGGVGHCPFKIATGCICWQHSRFTLDYFARSFAPEMDQFSVAVLDSSGNLIMRIGQYGNVDDGIPLYKAAPGARNPNKPLLVPPSPRPLGGDEVALMHACHAATMTDRYLYIGDVGNARIVQVKLDYHTTRKIKLRDVSDK